MSADEKTINTFATRVRQLILEFGKLKQENAELYEMVDERDAQIKALQEKLSQAEHDYNSLKMAKMMTFRMPTWKLRRSASPSSSVMSTSV